MSKLIVVDEEVLIEAVRAAVVEYPSYESIDPNVLSSEGELLGETVLRNVIAAVKKRPPRLG